MFGKLQHISVNKNKKMKLSIVVPTYNEGKRVIDTVNKILSETKNIIIVVDDGSTDKTFEMLFNNFDKNKRVFLLSHILNLGKGAAMKTGVKMAWKLKCTGIIFVDADGQHNPKHIGAFERALVKSDLVFGYRSMGVEMPAVRRYGNIFSVNLIKILFYINRTDLLCGFFGFNRVIYKKIRWESSRYGVETEIATRVGKNKTPFFEVKVDTIYIDKYKGVTIFDAFKILLMLPYWYYKK